MSVLTMLNIFRSMASETSTVLLPIVRWAQNKEIVSLKIELLECKHPNIQLKPDSIHFEATGIGAKGENRYGFSLEFLRAVKSESVVHKVTGSYVEILLSKEEGEWWPRLTKASKSPHFLKVDFDKWKSESDDEEKEVENDIMEQIQKERELHEKKLETLKTGYLVIYNTIQFLIHLYIFLFCSINLSRGGSEVFAIVYKRCGKSVQLAVILSWLETVHPYTGLTKGSWFTPCIQSFGRSFAMFCLWLTSADIMYEWYITCLFLAWSGIELIRYPLYTFQLLKIHVKFLTWVRYNIWIPLYPFGTLMEILLYIDAAYALEAKNLYEIQLPNALNFAFKFSWLIRVYVALLVYAISLILIPHMWKQRKIKLGGRKKYKQP